MKSCLVDSECARIGSLIVSKFRHIFVASILLGVPVTNVYANNITVNTNTPDISIGDGKCALIEAINEAQVPGSSYGDCPPGSDGADTITLEAGGPYSLTSVNNDTDGPNGLPSITTDITINGNGEIIERGLPPSFDPLLFRIFHVGLAGTLRLNHLTVQHGLTFTEHEDGSYESFPAAGIYNTGMLTLSNCRVSDNNGGFAEAILNTATGTVEISDSVLNRNTPDALDNLGFATIRRSTVSNNGGDGGGAFFNIGDMKIVDSLIYNNYQLAGAGGILIQAYGASAKLVLVNTTVTGNSSSIGVHGIWLGGDATAEIISSTIADNGDEYAPSLEAGGGASIILRNTVLSSNVQGSTLCSGNIISMGHNVASDGSCNLTGPGDQPYTDPLLGDLADNGGPTMTRALLTGSPAIDAGEANCTDTEGAPLLTDQRGMPRPADGNSDGYTACDIGAYEVGPAATTVDIDIKPGTNQNPVNPRSRGKLKVAILTSETFDAGMVDVSTVRFGPGNAEPITYRLDDVDHDGDWDLVFMVKTQDTSIACGYAEATLTAQTLDGVTINGTDSIKTVGCKPKQDRAKNAKKH